MVAPNDTWMGASDGYDKTSSIFAAAEWSKGYVMMMIADKTGGIR